MPDNVQFTTTIDENKLLMLNSTDTSKSIEIATYTYNEADSTIIKQQRASISNSAVLGSKPHQLISLNSDSATKVLYVFTNHTVRLKFCAHSCF